MSLSTRARSSISRLTSPKAGLEVRAELDTNTYPAGIKVTDAELAAIAIERHSFHGEWNYTLAQAARNPTGAVICARCLTVSNADFPI
jgi:Rhodopirellula transposase DDE domain